jgi:hypothetical protein
VVAGLACPAVASVAVATRRQQVRVVDDVDHPGSARLAASVAGPPWLSPLVLFFGGLGLLLLAAAAINLAVETWSP